MSYSLWFPLPCDQWKSPFDGVKLDPEVLRKAVENFEPPDLSGDLQLKAFETKVTWRDLLTPVD